MDVKDKYDRAARIFEFLNRAGNRRWTEKQTEFFRGLKGKVLHVGIGPGLETIHFPPGLDITAIDISRNMLEIAKRRVPQYDGKLKLCAMDAEAIGFPDNCFDTVLTVCVFCSVPHPIRGLRELKRVLKPGGNILMFEHVLSKNPIYGLSLRIMSQFTSRFLGPHLDRDTIGNLRKAGFIIESDQNVYLDIVKNIIGRKEPEKVQ